MDARSNGRITCTLKDVGLARGNGFRLDIPEFIIPPTPDLNLNKIPFMGVSGAGKSTLLNLLAAIEWPQQGTISWMFPDHVRISWANQGPSAAEARALRRQYFGYAFQDSTLMPHLRVCDNLSYPLQLIGYSVKHAYDRAWEALDHMLLDDERKHKQELFQRFPAQLSGGQRQRVALTQAMIHNPYVLFADEPTGSLDRDTRKQIMQVLYDWVDAPEQANQRLLLWVTHHENDPRDAGVQETLYIKAGSYTWKSCGFNERRDDRRG